jgi:hypothetical protein
LAKAEVLPTIIEMSARILFYKGRTPAFSEAGKDAKRQFLSFILDSLENPDLLDHNELEFSREWFGHAERMAKAIVNAKKIGDPRTGIPLKPDTVRSQKRIAKMILEKAEIAKRAASGDLSSMSRCGAEILHLFQRIQSEGDRIRGRKMANAEHKGGMQVANAAQERNAELQREADDLRKRFPSYSDSEIARRIIKKRKAGDPDDTSNFDTIRRAIAIKRDMNMLTAR